MDDVDLDADSTYLLNKYFILPVLSLNTSVTNLDSTVTSFNNSSSVIANTSSIIRLNASTLANTSSITTINASILANTSSITMLNASILANTSSITIINASLSNAIDTVNSTTLTIGGTNGTSTQSYASALTSGTLNIGNSQTAGILNIGTGNNVLRSGAINMATVTGSTCPINILNGGGATTGGSVNIANGTLQTTTINIASGTGTGTVTIGNISNTTTLASATINMNGNLTMGTGKNITLTTAPIAATAFTMLGGVSSTGFNVNIGTNPANGTYVMSSIQIPNSGTYLVTFLIQIVYSTSFNYFYSNVVQTDTAQTVGSIIGTHTFLLGVNWGQQPLGNVGSLFMTTNGSFVFTATANKYYNLILYLSGGGSLGTPNGIFQLVRLA